MSRPALLLALASALGISTAAATESVVIDKAATRLQVQVTDHAAGQPKPKLTLNTTMATWCVACKAEMPQLMYLRSTFKPEELGMVGLPYDEKDAAASLKAWAAANHAPYELLADLSKDDILSIKAMVLTTFRMDAVPAAFVTDADGHILRAKLGPPSVSEIRELLRAQRDRK